MNDPLRANDKPAPRRAEPLQPDDPRQGNEVQVPDERTASQERESLDRAIEQAHTARDNVHDV